MIFCILQRGTSIPSVIEGLQKSQMNQPVVVAIGTSQQREQIFVHAEGELLEARSVVSATDKAFKLFFICNMQYSHHACHVWQFMQKGLYGIQDGMTTYACVKKLLAHLKTVRV